MNFKWISALLILPFLMVSCTDEPDVTPVVQDTIVHSSAVYIMNEGLFNGNNAGITRFTFSDSASVADFFMQQNGRGLGDTGSDLAVYGSKLYAVVNVSSQLEVMDAATGISLKQIPMFDGNSPRQPRKIAFYGNKAFVCCFDGTVAVVDTTTLAITSYINAGLNPDAILSAGGKIWVSNSGGLNFPAYNNTVSVIDPVSLSQEKEITVGTNPFTMAADAYGDIYLISRGNYGDEKSRLQVIDMASQTVKHTFTDFEAINFSIAGDSAYVYNYDWMTGENTLRVIDVKTEAIISNQFITDGTALQTVYGISADPVSGLIFISDAMGFTGNGKVYAFTKTGRLRYTFDAGLNPSVFAFLYSKEISSH